MTLCAVVLAGLVLALPLAVQAADIPYEFPSPAAEQQYRQLTEELRCLVCQNQSLADSHADLAQDLRQEIHARVIAGAGNDEIIDFMVHRYGDFVLYRPPLRFTTVLLWFGPFLLLAVALGVAWRVARARTAAPPEPLSEQERLRVGALLDEADHRDRQ